MSALDERLEAIGSPPLKKCTKCGVAKRSECFSRNRRKSDGLDLHCRDCIRKRIRNKKALHLAHGKCADCGGEREGGSHSYCLRCLRIRASTERSRQMRAQALAAYGGEAPRCACCGEERLEFLTLDHVNNGGRAHRREKGNQGVYHELRRAGYPSGFQVLCFNCNIARGLYKVCPHRAVGQQVLQGRMDPIDTAISEVRNCTACRRDLPYASFYADRGTRLGLQSRCRECTRAASIARLNAARFAALRHYSSGELRCTCCGEDEPKFLALDHVNGEGPRMSGIRPGGNVFFTWLQHQGFPPGLQVLCHNCNCAKGKNPTCPHSAGRGN
jgi:hypothetical protein